MPQVINYIHLDNSCLAFYSATFSGTIFSYICNWIFNKNVSFSVVVHSSLNFISWLTTTIVGKIYA